MHLNLKIELISFLRYLDPSAGVAVLITIMNLIRK